MSNEKTLGEIIDDVRDGKECNQDDLRFAICVMDALMAFDRQAFMSLHEGEIEDKSRKIPKYSPVCQCLESISRMQLAMEQPPKKYLGWGNNPDNPEFLKRRQFAKRLCERIAEKP